MVARDSVICLVAIFLFGCSSASASPKPTSTATATLNPAPSVTPPPTATPEYVDKLRNAKYQLGFSDALRVVQLQDGKFEQGTVGGADYVSVNVTDFIASGDLNNDGRNEFAALVAENYGGSGTFVFLAVYADVSGTLTFQTSILVDDRPMLNALSIKNGEIFVDAIIHGASDPMCCPTLKMTRHYQLVASNQLTMTNFSTFTIDGKPRTITIDTPVNGTQANSTIQFKGSVTIAPFENNLVYRVFDLVGVELASGSISVTAAQPGGPGTFNTAVSLGNILSGASVRVQIQDVNVADGSLLAMDSVELVVK